jgi:hypothetical protein
MPSNKTVKSPAEPGGPIARPTVKRAHEGAPDPTGYPRDPATR